MILRWSDPAYGQHYLDGITHAVIARAVDWRDSARIIRMTADPDQPMMDVDGNVPDGVVDLAKAYQCQEVVHLVPRSLWAEPRTSDAKPPSVVSVLAYDGTGGPTLHTILCTWGAFLNDNGDTIDQWNVYMKNRHMWEHLLDLPAGTEDARS